MTFVERVLATSYFETQRQMNDAFHTIVNVLHGNVMRPHDRVGLALEEHSHPTRRAHGIQDVLASSVGPVAVRVGDPRLVGERILCKRSRTRFDQSQRLASGRRSHQRLNLAHHVPHEVHVALVAHEVQLQKVTVPRPRGEELGD
eukprot:1230398-Pyramimonas_sp.AAC.1